MTQVQQEKKAQLLQADKERAAKILKSLVSTTHVEVRHYSITAQFIPRTIKV